MFRDSAAPNRTLLVTAFSHQLFALDRATGAVRWELVIGDKSDSEVEIAIVDGVVIAATPFDLCFVDYATGQPYKQVKISMEFKRRPTMLVDDGHVYLSGDGSVMCFTLRGDVVWTQPFKGKGFGSLALGLPGNVRQADDPGFR